MAEKKHLHSGHRARVRERFRQQGFDGFSEHEVLELLLTYAIPQKDVNPLAHELINTFGSLSQVLEAEASELMRVPGVGENAAVLLCMMPQLLGYYQKNAMGAKPVISNLEQARRYCSTLFFGQHMELFYVVCLNKSGQVIHPTLLQTGTIDEVSVYPRMVVEAALRHHAHTVLLAHNHPSGVEQPSGADYKVTQLIINALSTISIGVVDHVIISGEKVYSMTQRSQGDTGPASEFSYVLRSTNVPGIRGRLREDEELQFITMLPTVSFSGGIPADGR